MTIEDVKAMTKETITPNVAAAVIGCDPNWIRLCAQREPGRLPFPTFQVGNRTKIPRIAFIRYMEGRK